jgi:hypothetical protein
MEKLIFSWDKLADFGVFSCFAISEDLVVVSEEGGKVKVFKRPNFEYLYKVLIENQPVEKIFHLKERLFGIVQNFFYVVQALDEFWNVKKIVKDRVLGSFDDVLWTKFTVIDMDARVLYKIPENEGEIVQVCKVDQTLIISSLVKTVLVKEKVTQIGKKERNGPFGACEYMNSIYAARPLGNMWQANFQGVVMITTNYKINSEKVNFGSLFKMDKFLLSINKTSKNFIVINPSQLSVIHFENFSEDSEVFFNSAENSLYKKKDFQIFKAQVLTVHQFYYRLLNEDADQAVKFVLENQSLHDLELLQPLCYQVFHEKREIEPFEQFVTLIQKLEENMQLPVIPVQMEVVENDEMFDEFLRLNYLENLEKKKKNRGKVDKRIRKFYRYNFTKVIICNYLMFVILKKNYQLEKIRGWVKVAEKSLDYVNFRALVNEEKKIVDEISGVL